MCVTNLCLLFTASYAGPKFPNIGCFFPLAWPESTPSFSSVQLVILAGATKIEFPRRVGFQVGKTQSPHNLVIIVFFIPSLDSIDTSSFACPLRLARAER